MSERHQPRFRSRRSLLAATVLVAFAALVGCAPIQPQQQAQSAPGQPATPAAPAAPAAKEPKRGGTLTIAQPNDVPNFDVYVLLPGNYMVAKALFNTLIRYDSNLKPQPELAESWSFSQDGKSMELKLRQGVLFHNGAEFTANDVAFSVERAQDKSVGAVIRGLALDIKKVEARDKSTVVLRFDSPNPGIFDVLDQLFIVQKDTAASIKNKPVGTGPFYLAEWIPNQQVVLKKNDKYWEKGLPYLDQVVIKPLADSATLVSNLEAGTVDLIWRPNLTDLVRMKSRPDLVTDTGPLGFTFYDIIFNTKVKPFDDKRVRTAISYAIDRERFTKVALQGLVGPTCLPYPTYSWAYDKAMDGQCAFNLEKAKQLLTEAGYPNGFEATLLTSRLRNQAMADLAQIMAADLGKIGVKVKIEDLPVADIEGRTTKGDYQFATHTFGRANKDPGTLFGGAKVWWAEGNFSKWTSDEYKRLIKQGASTLDQDQRKQAYAALAKLALDENFALSIAYDLRPWAWRARVKDLNINLDHIPLLGRTWLDK